MHQRRHEKFRGESGGEVGVRAEARMWSKQGNADQPNYRTASRRYVGNDHSNPPLSLCHQKNYLGVAQMAARVIRDHEAAGSRPATKTIYRGVAKR